MGLNGAGKSTLVKLLCRFYDPTRGAVLWDGVDLRELDVAEVRRRTSAVFQDFMMYELSAAENVGLLLILDEPSAGLDPEAEHEIHSRLRAYRDGRTSLLISHRLSAVRNADTIVVLADGQVAERGNHAELIAADGRYARLFRLQARGYQDEAAASVVGAG